MIPHYTTLHTHINGIDCTVRVKVTPGSRGKRDRYGVPMEPDDPAATEIVGVYDVEEKPATWLRDMITEADEERIGLLALEGEG